MSLKGHLKFFLLVIATAVTLQLTMPIQGPSSAGAASPSGTATLIPPNLLTTSAATVVHKDGSNRAYIAAADTDAARGAALIAAETAAISGDTIYVAPGTYSVTVSLAKDGCNWWFAPGATVSWTLGGTGYLFDDGGSVMTYSVGGAGKFIRRPDLYLNAATNTAGVYGQRNASTNVSFDFDRVRLEIVGNGLLNDDEFARQYNAVAVQAGKFRCRGHRLEVDIENFPSGAALPVQAGLWWKNGEMNCDIQEIASVSADGQDLGAPAIWLVWSGVTQTTRTINAASNATPIAITTSAPHTYLTGAKIDVYNVGGNTAANGTWTITVTGASTFTLNGSVGNSAYTSGGTAVPSATGDLRVRAQTIRYERPSGQNADYFYGATGNTPSAAAWIDSTTLKGIGNSSIGKHYFTTQKVDGGMYPGGSSSAAVKVYIRANKFGGSGAGGGYLLDTQQGGLYFVNVDQWEPDAGLAGTINVTGGGGYTTTINLSGQDIPAPSNSPGGAGVTATIGVYAGGTLNFLSGVVSGSNLHLSNVGGAINVSAAAVYDGAKTSGTITKLKSYGVTPP